MIPATAGQDPIGHQITCGLDEPRDAAVDHRRSTLRRGSNRPLVFSLVLRDALLMTVAGIAAGVLLSLSFTRFLARVIRKLPAFDTAAYALASAIVLLLSVSATSIPARQAAGTDPMQVLRGD